MGGEFSTDSKSLNGIKISWFVQVLLHFYWFGGYPPGGGWVGGWGWGWSWVGAPPTHVCMHTCMHACTRMCAHTCMHVEHDKHGCLHGGGHLQFPNMFILAFRACACMHMCMCTCLGTPPMPPDAPQPICPLPRAAGSPGSPNHQKFISPELIEIIQFCLKNLYLWTFLNSSRLTLITLDTPTHLPRPPGAEEAEILKTL